MLVKKTEMPYFQLSDSNMMRNTFFFLALLAFGFVACNDDPVFPAEPQIEFVDIQPRVVKSLRDSIVITIRFQDGDGDLGALTQGEENLFLIDNRFNQGLITEEQATNPFSVMNLTPDARNPSIQGTITVTIPLTAKITANPNETTKYQIKLYDRAGNLATPLDGDPDNVVFTDEITIVQ
jgi:hypothetical protein